MLRHPANSSTGVVARLAVALAFIFLTAQARAQQIAETDVGPFGNLAGTWSGSGTISVNNGSTERIRCRVNYVVGGAGTNVKQELRCASDSYKFELTSNVNYNDGYITGRWTETTRNVGGNVSGRASSTEIEGLVESSGFAANLSVQTRGDRQSVVIKPRGIDVTEVAMTLRKGGH